MNLLPNKQLLILYHFNQPKIEWKKFVWTTKYKRLLEMCTLQYVELKCVFTFQSKKRPVSTTVKNAKRAALFYIIVLRTKNGHFCSFAVMLHIALQKKDESRLRKWKTISIFEENSPPSTTKHFLSWAKKSQNRSIYGITVSTPQRLIQLSKNSITIRCIHFQFSVKLYDFLSLQRRDWVVFRRWTRVSDSDCADSHPRKDKRIPRTLSGSLEFVVVSKTKVFGRTSIESSSYP